MTPTATDDPCTRLAVYGTLAPGKPNHHHIVDLTGRWSDGIVRGRLIRKGWGAALGYPGLVLDDTGPAVLVQVLTSPDLPANWQRLDDFEGPGYQRVSVPVNHNGLMVPAYIYVLAGH